MPLVPDLNISPEFFKIDPKKVLGLSIEAEKLLIHRRHRMRRLGIKGPSSYSDPKAIKEEINYFNWFINKYRITTVNVTNKPIETTADEVIRIINNRFEVKSDKG